MTRKRRRLYFVALGLFGLFAGTGLVLFAFQDNLNYFFSTTEMAAKKPSPGQQVYTGGLVEKGSVIKNGATVTFTVTDLTTNNSLLRALHRLAARSVQGGCRRGGGEGHLGADGVLPASEVTWPSMTRITCRRTWPTP